MLAWTLGARAAPARARLQQLVALGLLGLVACGAPDSGSTDREVGSPGAPGASDWNEDSSHIVILSFDGLRRDVVGALGAKVSMTPNLDRFLENADLAGTAVAASPQPETSTASALTGLPVWRHRAWGRERASVVAESQLLAERLSAAGYSTRLFRASSWLTESSRLLAGFDEVRTIHSTRSVVRGLTVSGEASLTYVDLGEPVAPFEKSRATVQALASLEEAGVAAADLPARLTVRDLETASNSGPEARRELEDRAWVLYCGEVIQADRSFAAIVSALEAGASENVSIVVLSSRGQALLGEELSGENAGLSRSLLEVPFGVRLGRAARARFESEPSRDVLVPIGSLAATVLDLAGLERPPGITPSAFELSEQQAEGGWSERYAPDGEATYSWLSRDAQLIATEHLLADSLGGRRLRPDGRASAERRLEDALRLLEMGGEAQVRVRSIRTIDGAAVSETAARDLGSRLESTLLMSGRRVTLQYEG